MAYEYDEELLDRNFLRNINRFKEFAQLAQLAQTDSKSATPSPRRNPATSELTGMIDDQIRRGNYMIPKSYQIFARMFINPNTPWPRLLIKHNTGAGKTSTALGVSIDFINLYHQEAVSGSATIGSIFIFGFDQSKVAFERELFRYSEFGFVSKDEVRQLSVLIRRYAKSQLKSDKDRIHELKSIIRRRLYNRKNYGFFKFMGYKEFSNRLLITNETLTSKTEDDITRMVDDGLIKLNEPLIASFANSLMICDEIQNVYNSVNKNNWGIAIQIILDRVPTLRALFLSATPINNSPTEAVDMINLLVPKSLRVRKVDLYNADGTPKPKTMEKLANLSIGRISYVNNVDPRYYPSWKFIGESIPGIAYLKFIRCPMTQLHQTAYNEAVVKDSGAETVASDSHTILDMVFPHPSSPTKCIYKSSEMSLIRTAPIQWRNKHGIEFPQPNQIAGEFCRVDNIKPYSTKYHRLITDVIDTVKNQRGKTFIYHHYVSMSGVRFISSLLTHNGIIAYDAAPGANTLCTVCGVVYSEHLGKSRRPAKSQSSSRGENDSLAVNVKQPTVEVAVATNGSHDFNAARHVTIHGQIDNSQIARMLEIYNTPRNATGVDIMVVIGSQMMQEAREVRNTENLAIVHKPDDMSNVIQIIGRVRRTNSHSDLPVDRRNVDIRIYVSSMSPSTTSSTKLSYEEVKYMEKVNNYRIIQQQDRLFHQVAVDGSINYAMNIGTPGDRGSSDDVALGDLPYEPAVPWVEPKHISTATFDVFHTTFELEMITYIIKRIYVEHGTSFTYDGLWHLVTNCPFSTPVNTRMFDQANFNIALTHMLFDSESNQFVNDARTERRMFLDRMFNYLDKRIVLIQSSTASDSSVYGGIVQVGKYYTLFPIINNVVQVGIDVFARISTHVKASKVNLQMFMMSDHNTTKSYRDKLVKFRAAYSHATLDKLGDALCQYDLDFHTQFIKECIEYIFNAWTNPTYTKNEHHEFYFRMIYYYDIYGLVIWADMLDDGLAKRYSKYTLPKVSASKGTNAANRKGETALVRQMTRKLHTSGCNWCPDDISADYHTQVSSNLSDIATRIKKGVASGRNGNAIIKVAPNDLPVGHLISTVARCYDPNIGLGDAWFDVPTFSTSREWKDNDIIVGYDTKNKSALRVLFRVRTPIHKMKKVDDVRKAERGIMCASLSKPRIEAIAKSIGVEKLSNNIENMCEDVRARLIYLDIAERNKGTNIKWFYNFWENQPTLKQT